MGFSRQEYWSRLPCLTPGDFPEPEIEPMALAVSPTLQVDSLPPCHLGSPDALQAFLKSVDLLLLVLQ